MRRVIEVINDAHLNTNSTLGNPKEVELYGDPLTPSVNFSTAYAFRSVEELGAYHDDKYDSVRYARDSSLLVRQLEHYFELMHQGCKCLLFNSGMAALSACFSAFLNARSSVVTFGSFYRKSLSILKAFEEKFGGRYLNFPSYGCEGVEELDGPNTLVLVESPSNPFLRLVDLEEVRKRLPSSIIVVDTTFQGLLNSKSELAGADLVTASCTKYIGGHNDVLGGFVVCKNRDTFSSIWDERSMRGGILDNHSAYLLLRSLRTYDLRMEKTLQNASLVLDFLKGHAHVHRLYYPGWGENSDQAALFQQEHYHGGGVVTFRTGDRVNLKSNMKRLCSTKMAPSFGSVDTLVEIPMYMSHWGEPLNEVAKLGLDPQTVRLSVGNEPIRYILDDLQRLLDVREG